MSAAAAMINKNSSRVTVRPATIHGYKKDTGTCVHCGTAATKEVHFHEKDGIVVERYCDDCCPKQEVEQ